ncbi:adenylate/guanylate cyclase domain-containing protein [Methylocystis parvus]|uniref:HAMP domain-containing protein n=1 Tax=Methylocystis parvus TaxID=134 RepID=A0A6B8LXT9_9HYPH|nr:adenylate/guanylate cyclase domain-containing protein [Methylocystis parvus]QGM97227.1 HAMP domain-containing protein [Methylocystis parvus]WBJ98866.1 HAMP domain-containing protein [Methylocystis parvus OBBP]
MFSASIRRKIMGIALALIVLMAITSVASLVLVRRVGDHFEELASGYMPAYGNLARAHIRSLERALALRRMAIETLAPSTDKEKIETLRKAVAAKGQDVEREVAAARAVLGALIKDGGAFDDQKTLVRLDAHLDSLMNETRRFLSNEIETLLKALEAGDSRTVAEALARVDQFRDEVNRGFESVRTEMLSLLRGDGAVTIGALQQVMWIATALTLLAAALGVIFSTLVSDGVTGPVRRLLDGTRAVEAGELDQVIAVTTRDEIGHLTAAFNRMVEQLRLKERILDTFGRYIDPRVVQGLIDKPTLAADGQRRVMTILFCDLAGFTGTSERMTPQGLVKILNRYFSTMSEPIRENDGVIDKYIGDAIMAYWGPPFNEDDEQTGLACLAALDMMARVEELRNSLPELLGMRNAPISIDLRIGVATGEALVGSIGSEQMMNYTVIGDTVNLASRLEGACKHYGVRALVAESTAKGAGEFIEIREIDRVAMAGQGKPERIFEIMGRKGALTRAQSELRENYSDGLAAFRRRDWDGARRAFAAALAVAPEDGPSHAFLARIDEIAASPPREDWDGSWRFDQK